MPSGERTSSRPMTRGTENRGPTRSPSDTVVVLRPQSNAVLPHQEGQLRRDHSVWLRDDDYQLLLKLKQHLPFLSKASILHEGILMAVKYHKSCKTETHAFWEKG